MPDLPLVIIHNYLETFREFLARTHDETVVEARSLNGDQALFWHGDNKLVISSAPIENTDGLIDKWGYKNVQTLSPKNPTQQLSWDVMIDGEMIKVILRFAGKDKAIQMIPYATTGEFLELVAFLRDEHGLKVEQIESPTPGSLWTRDLLDSKIGFRSMVSQWGIDNAKLPFGFICKDIEQVINAVQWFAGKGQGCVVKADKGGSGVGNLFIKAGEQHKLSELLEMLSDNEFLRDDLFVVEELIKSDGVVSPSLEFVVPAVGEGAPKMTYLCNQHFEASGQFAGVYISKEIEDKDWYAGFYEAGMQIAAKVQELGYVGIFDLDAIVDDSGELYLVEINARRTGATFVDDFMRYYLGDDYLEKVSVYSQNKLKVGNEMDLAGVEAVIGDLIYLPEDGNFGVVVMLTSALRLGYIGYVAVGNTLNEVELLKSEMSARFSKFTAHSQ